MNANIARVELPGGIRTMGKQAADFACRERLSRDDVSVQIGVRIVIVAFTSPRDPQTSRQ